MSNISVYLWFETNLEPCGFPGADLLGSGLNAVGSFENFPSRDLEGCSVGKPKQSLQRMSEYMLLSHDRCE